MPSKKFIPFLETARRAAQTLRMSGNLSAEPEASFTTLSNTVINERIAEIINTGRPSMIARFGVGELKSSIRYAHIMHNRFNPVRYLFANGEPGWWTEDIRQTMPVFNGFFPATDEYLNRFGEKMLQDMQELDILGCWQQTEQYFTKELEHVAKANLQALEPYYFTDSWSKSLAGKKVLVIHPFEKSIRMQYAKRDKLFADSSVLPDFELITIKAVQTLAGNTSGFSSWFEALDFMEQKMKDTDFDVAIIGAGAYGFPLAATAKRLGKIGIQMGGSTQILFGIKGQRWEEKKPKINRLFNEHWVRPLEEERPPNAEKVEGACYW